MKPNFLFFFTDQCRYDAIAAHGNPNIRTPNLDRLIGSGTTFSNAYTPSPVCVAARCSLHYGQYPVHTGTYGNTPMPSDGRPSYVGLLTENGYRTHGIGKCHFFPDLYAMRGYETREVQEEGGGPLEKNPYLKTLVDHGFGYAIEPFGVRSEMYYLPQPSRLPQELHPTQWIGDRTIDFLENQDNTRPWYLFSSFIHPHPPFAPPSPWHTLYRASDMPLPNLPENYESLQIFINKLQNRYKYRDRGCDLNLMRTMKAYYYACISFVDYQIGRVLDALERSGQMENTIILFASDHGELLGDYGSFGKRSMHNAAARIPLIACGGPFTGGGICETPVSLVDIAPTLLAAAGADASPLHPDGVPLQSVLSGTCTRKGVYSFFSSRGEVGMVCGTDQLSALGSEEEKIYACMNMMYAEQDCKYIYSAPDNRELLFDEAENHLEQKNLIYDAAYRDRLHQMREHLMSYLQSENHTCLLGKNGFEPLIHETMPSDPDRGLIRQDFRPPWFDMGVLKDYQ